MIQVEFFWKLCVEKKVAGSRFLFVFLFHMLWDTGVKLGSVAAILPPWSVNFRLTLTLQQTEKQREIVSLVSSFEWQDQTNPIGCPNTYIFWSVFEEFCLLFVFALIIVFCYCFLLSIGRVIIARKE